MAVFFSYSVIWFKSILSWVYTNILSIRIGGVPIWGWMLSMLLLSIVSVFIFRARPDRNAMKNGGGIH